MPKVVRRPHVVALAPCALAVSFWLAAGCGRAPQAPALENGPVFKNSREGFRFLVPEGWIQYARGEVPPGPLATERMLVEYQLQTGDAPAKLSVTCIDIPNESVDLGQYVLENPKDQGWRYQTAPRTVTINGLEAKLIKLGGYLSGKAPWTRDVYTFRRGERVYLFSGTYLSADAKAERDIRRALESLIWDK
ncbi:MAG TPA: hypothetical protein VKI17_02240 [Gemmataceae bacterium]|nr:hypothetical protein [Gemmataceae bacterium]